MISNYQTKEAALARLMDSPVFQAELERAMLRDSVAAIHSRAAEVAAQYKQKRQARQADLDEAARRTSEALKKAQAEHDAARIAALNAVDDAQVHRADTMSRSHTLSELSTARASRLEELGIRNVDQLDAHLANLGVK